MPYSTANDGVELAYSLAISLVRVLLWCFDFCRRQCDADQVLQ